MSLYIFIFDMLGRFVILPVQLSYIGAGGARFGKRFVFKGNIPGNAEMPVEYYSSVLGTRLPV